MEAGPSGAGYRISPQTTRRILDEVSGMVRRIIKLSRLDAPKQPSNATSIYVQEAARAYIYGLAQTSVAMGRAALEQSLKEQLARQGKGDFITFQELVDEAVKWKIIDKVSAKEDIRTWGSSNVDPRNLHEYYLKPFEKITREAGVQAYMAAYNAINDLPCSVTNLFRDVARAQWGLYGFVVSDAWDLAVLVSGHAYTSSLAQGAAMMIQAGVDSITEDDAPQWITAALAQGYLTENDLDLALRRNFRIRFLTGEFDPPAMVSYTSIPDSALMSLADMRMRRPRG